MAELRPPVGPPQVSIVIPSRNRSERLRMGLAALAAQTFPPGRLEVIVVLDGSTDDSEAMLATIETPFTLAVLAREHRGAAATRNAGAAAAAGPLLLFLDDDMLAAPGLVEAHVRAHAEAVNGEDRVVIGYAKPDQLEGTSLFARQVRAWWEDVFAEMGEPWHRYSFRDLLSGNFSIPRALFERVGRFDESFACREDYELGWRLIEAGARLHFVREALSFHRDGTTAAGNFLRAHAEGMADARFISCHPNSLDALYLRIYRADNEGGGRRYSTRSAVAFEAKGLLDFGARSVATALPAFERIGMHASANDISGKLRRYWYLRGLMDSTGSPTAFEALRTSTPLSSRPPRLSTVDLAGGWKLVERRLVAERPDGLTVRFNDVELDVLKPIAGHEPLAPRHLAGFLGSRAWRWAQPIGARKAAGPLPASDAPAVAQTSVDDEAGRARGALIIGEVDVADWSFAPPLKVIDRPARLLVRHGPRPLGYVDLGHPPPGGYSPSEAARIVLAGREAALARHWAATAIGSAPQPPPAVPISVVICTRDRTENLARCMGAVGALDYPAFEVIIVDNAPSSDATRRLVETLPCSRHEVRYVREDRPGLDWARNRGVAEARHGVVAFTDDDTKPDRFWLWGLAQAFADPSVMATTGLVAPMKLETPAQRYFEDVYGGMGKGFAPRRIRRADLSGAGALWASSFGVGANMAFRRGLFEQVGGFDVALDVGTASRGGGDIEFFHRVVMAGHLLLYQPAALVWHEHRADWHGLRRQLADNGCSFAAFLLTCARNRTVSRLPILRFALVDWIGGWLLRLRRPGPHRRSLILAEIGGMLRGPAAYRRAQREAAVRSRAKMFGQSSTNLVQLVRESE